MAIPRRRRLPSYSYLAAAFALATVATLAAGEPTAWLCGKTGTFAADSTYRQNLQRVAAVLPNFTASAPTMSATATIGDIPDVVHAEAFCRGDAEALNAVATCRDCVATAFEDAQQTCVYQKAVMLFEDRCSLRFSNENLVDSPADDDDLVADTSNRSVSAPAQAFGAAVALLLEATLEHAATSALRFATAAQSFGHLGVGNMYAMAQCQPMTAAQKCHECLSQLLLGMPDSYQDKRDGKLLQWSCFLRFDDHPFFNGKPIVDLPPVPSGETRGDGWRKYKIPIAIAIFLTALFIMTLVFLLIKSRRKAARKVELQRNKLDTLWQTESSSEFTVFHFSELAAATGHFSDVNQLGSGGFGTVYKGKLGRGAEIAVKRLSSRSRQGLDQFKTEVQLIVKLQHTNLVRLVGCCVHEEEKLLVYEFMPNGSLDCFIFDQQRGSLLDWEKRVRIIEGIAQGLLYLHEHSRVRIIHRDLKTSNILLDGNMNPKISDFGLARTFPSNMSEVNTNTLVGTRGYMAPEYTSGGTFSVKSDVYSFGVLVLEIVSGKRVVSQNGSFDNLLEYAWQLWREAKLFELIDPTLGQCGQVMVSIQRCVKVALLCVQDSAADRPTMADVMAMLVSKDGSMSLPDPRRPQHISPPPRVTTSVLGIRAPSHGTTSINDVTVTAIQGR